MRRAAVWFNYARSIAEHSKDLAVYAEQWARDVRCVRSGMEHRRVGELTMAHNEWLRAGYAVRQAAVRLR